MGDIFSTISGSGMHRYILMKLTTITQYHVHRTLMTFLGFWGQRSDSNDHGNLVNEI